MLHLAEHIKFHQSNPSSLHVNKPLNTWSIMLSRQGLKIHPNRALSVLRISYPSTRSASFANSDLFKTSKLNPQSFKNIPLHILDDSPSRYPHFLQQVQSPSGALPSIQQSKLKIDTKSDDSNPPEPPKPKRERKKRETPATDKNEGGDKSEIENPETDKPVTGTDKSKSPAKSESASSGPTAPPAPPNNNGTPPPLPPRPKTPNDQKGSPTEKLYQSSSASNKEKVMILPINRRPLIPGKFKLWNSPHFHC